MSYSRYVEGVGEVQGSHVPRPRDGVQDAHGAHHGCADGDEDDERHEGAVVAGTDAVAGPATKATKRARHFHSGGSVKIHKKLQA